jgi:hypothetical protein
LTTDDVSAIDATAVRGGGAAARPPKAPSTAAQPSQRPERSAACESRRRETSIAGVGVAAIAA